MTNFGPRLDVGPEKPPEEKRSDGFHRRPQPLYLALGDRVLVVRGPLAGREGTVTQRNTAAAYVRFKDGEERLVRKAHLHSYRTQGRPPDTLPAGWPGPGPAGARPAGAGP